MDKDRKVSAFATLSGLWEKAGEGAQGGGALPRARARYCAGVSPTSDLKSRLKRDRST